MLCVNGMCIGWDRIVCLIGSWMWCLRLVNVLGGGGVISVGCWWSWCRDVCILFVGVRCSFVIFVVWFGICVWGV